MSTPCRTPHRAEFQQNVLNVCRLCRTLQDDIEEEEEPEPQQEAAEAGSTGATLQEMRRKLEAAKASGDYKELRCRNMAQNLRACLFCRLCIVFVIVCFGTAAQRMRVLLVHNVRLLNVIETCRIAAHHKVSAYRRQQAAAAAAASRTMSNVSFSHIC